MRFKHIILTVGLALGLLGVTANAAKGQEKTDVQSFVPPTYKYRSLASQSAQSDYWQQVGANAVLVGDYPNALAALNKAVDLAATPTPELIEQRGWVHYRLDNEDLALADLQTAADLYLSEQSYQDYINAQNMLMFIDS